MRCIGVDIGGTFTDLVMIDGDRIIVVKVPSNKQDPVASIRAGITECLRRFGSDDRVIDLFCYGTTIGTNAVLERRGSQATLLTTKGFRDVLELGTLKRPYEALYDLKFRKPAPLIPRSRRLEVDERIDADGQVHKALSCAEIDRVLDEVEAGGAPESIAICLLFSFKNAAHEHELALAAKKRFPNAFVVTSSDILPIIKEFERVAYSALSAYLGPLIHDHLLSLADSIGVTSSRGYFVMQSHDGLRSVLASIARPADIVLSGPAAGVVGAKLVGIRSGFENLISLDIGGTSTDVSLIERGAPRFSTERHIDQIPLTVPMVDIHTIGAGGGSKVWLDAAGGIRVGPQSAGANPGPACYGFGGKDPTVTDADVVLGYLNPRELLSGEKKIEQRLAVKAFETVSKQLDGSVVDTARGAVRIFVNAVQGAIRVVSVEQGHDPREFALVAFGGAGPTHSCEVADELAIQSVIVPPFPGLTSALGLLTADVSHDAVQMISGPIMRLGLDRLKSAFETIEKQAWLRLRADGVQEGTVNRSVEMRFPGQTYTIPVPIMSEGFDNPEVLRNLADDFAEQHRKLYGLTQPPERAEVVMIRSRVLGSIGGRQLSQMHFATRRTSNGAKHRNDRRLVRFFGHDAVETPIYLRDNLEIGEPISGPAIIEQYDTNTVLPPGWSGVQEPSGNLVLRKKGAI